MKQKLKKIKNSLFKRFKKSKYYFPVLKAMYTIMRTVLPIDKKLIVFESNVGKSIGDSPKAIYDKLQEFDLSYKYVWIYNGSEPIFNNNTKTVIRLGFKYYYYLARAGYWVNNQNFPTYLVKRKKTIYLQTWHGTPLKKMQNDLDIIIGRDGTYLERVNFAVSQWDYLISPSEYATEHFKTAFNYNKEILEVGYPRNDIFYQEESILSLTENEVKKRLGLEGEFRKIILYAPTFRDDSLSKFNLELDLEKFTEELADDYLLLVRGHMATGQKINIPKKFTGDILNVSSYPNIQELYLISDLCVTDYSSVMFDFANTKRPVLFFTYDLEHYKDNLRGFYMDFIEEAPGTLAKTTEELIEAIKETENSPLSDKYQEFFAKYCYLEDGRASERVIEKVFVPDLTKVKRLTQLNNVQEEANVSIEMSVVDDSFKIDADVSNKLILCNGTLQITLPSTGISYLLSENELNKVFTKNKGQAIFKTENQTDFYVEHFLSESILSLSLKNNIYYLSINQEKKLVIDKNQKPDLTSYYLKHRVLKNEVTNDYIVFNFEVITLESENISINQVLWDKQSRILQKEMIEEILTEEISSGIYKHTGRAVFDRSSIINLFEETDISEREILELCFGIEIIEKNSQQVITCDQFWLDMEDTYSEKIDLINLYCLSLFSPNELGKAVLKLSFVSKVFYNDQIVDNSVNLPSYLPDISELDEVQTFFCKMIYLGLMEVKSDIISVSVKNDKFILKEKLATGPLYLKNRDLEKEIFVNDAGNYEISKKDINSVIGTSNSISVVDSNRQPISIDFYNQLSGEDRLELSGFKNSYYLYKGVADNLRISKNVLPSYKSYYINHSTEKIISDGIHFSIDITVRTQFYALNSVQGRVKLRGTKVFSEINGEIISTEHKKNGYVINRVRLVFSAENIFSVARNVESRLYNYDIFDFMFSFTYQNQSVDSFVLDLKFGDIVEETLHLHSNNMFLFFYPTIIGNLSAKMTLISEDIYEYYKKQLNRSNKLSENKKLTVLVTEYPHKAQDTGLAYFKYLVDNHSNELDVYYLISTITKDMDNLEGYMDNVVYYKSKEHVDVFLNADILASSHGTNYACPVVDKASKVILQEKFKVFLQHGILGVRDMTHLYGKNEDNPFTNLFVTSSKREREMIIDEFGYKPNEVVLAGLPRFDRLFENLNKNKNKLETVIIMPSWREGLDNKTLDEFKKSLFFKSFNELLTSEELKSLTEKNNIKLKFYLHTNFQKYTSCFTSDFIEILTEGKQTVQDILIESDCLITDYSSVGLDFALMEKPIIYYQFDSEIKNSRNLLNHHFFPGEIKRTVHDIVEEFEYLVEYPKMREQHLSKLDDLYLYRDTHANDRIYEAMIREYKNYK